jgi:hypothetical protein
MGSTKQPPRRVEGLAWWRLLLVLALCLLSTTGRAHEVIPSIMDVGMSDDRPDRLSPDRLSIELTFTAEAFLAGLDLSTVFETDESDQGEAYDRIRALPAEALSTLVTQRFSDLAKLITVTADGQRLDLVLESVFVEEKDDFSLIRQTKLYLGAPLKISSIPKISSIITAGLDKTLGAVLIRQSGAGSDPDYSDYLVGGGISSGFALGTVTPQSAREIVLKYLHSGIIHIVPAGLDHILFVIGLLAFSLSGKNLVLQISLFTLAHTLTLALASLGWVIISGAVVEPLIALSIAYIGVENISRRSGRLTPVRCGVVFAFGLLHGLGFASVLSEFGLPAGGFALGLLSFNIGVEIGQLMVVVPIFAAAAFLRLDQLTFRRAFQLPVSAVISIVGLYWAAQRMGMLPNL